MQLIHQLNEASGLHLDSLKKAMMKDVRTKQLFTRDLDISEISNVPEFVNSVKFFLLNNRNVLEFVKQRSDVKSLSDRALKRLREIRPKDFTQKDLEAYQEFATDLFREFGHVERVGLSAETRRELVDWANGNGRYFNLSRGAQRELASVPGLKPEREVVLYRGLLFSSHDLKERKTYDGSLEVGAGLKFLRSIREGTRVVDLSWDRPSSWSTSKQTAMQFARFKSASSNFGATMQWLQREGHIDGDLGFIVSVRAKPEDVLIDMGRLVTKAHLQHGDEGEIILKPGSYTCRVFTKLTKQGEVDPVARGAGTQIAEMIGAIRKFSETWTAPDIENSSTKGWGYHDLDRLLRNGSEEELVELTRTDTRNQALSSLETLISFYKDVVASVDQEELHQNLAGKNGKIIQWAIDLQKQMTEKRKAPGLEKAERLVDLTLEQIRSSFSSYYSKAIGEIYSGRRFTDRTCATLLEGLARVFGVSAQAELHRAGKDVQQNVAAEIATAAAKAMKVAEPASNEDRASVIKNLIVGAARNGSVLNLVSGQRKTLTAAVQGTVTD